MIIIVKEKQDMTT